MHLLGAHSAHVDDYGGDAEAPVTVSEDIPFYASVIEFDLFSLWPDTAAPVTAVGRISAAPVIVTLGN
eukprot:353500-Chlamydomonas_euryale.AAC.8